MQVNFNFSIITDRSLKLWLKQTLKKSKYDTRGIYTAVVYRRIICQCKIDLNICIKSSLWVTYLWNNITIYPAYPIKLPIMEVLGFKVIFSRTQLRCILCTLCWYCNKNTYVLFDPININLFYKICFTSAQLVVQIVIKSSIYLYRNAGFRSPTRDIMHGLSKTLHLGDNRWPTCRL